jgi:methionyl-tRNA synthetase
LTAICSLRQSRDRDCTDVPLKVPKESKMSTWFMQRLAAISQAVEGKDWEPYWKDQEENWFNFIGKDTSFSPVIFPAMLMKPKWHSFCLTMFCK